jgi:hypothetical protein
MFEEMEKEMINLIMQNESILNKQHLSIINREFMGAGFFSYFEGFTYDSDLQISNIGALLNNSIQVGFTLFINKGKMNFLEGYTYNEPWPKDIETYEVFLVEPKR